MSKCHPYRIQLWIGLFLTIIAPSITAQQAQYVKDIVVKRSADYQPSWSPNGREIAFTTGRTGNYEIYVMDIYDGRFDNVSRHPENDFYAVWCPRGRHIAYFSERDPEDEEKDNTTLGKVVSWDQRPVSSARNAERPSWMPDGKWFVYHESESGNFDIYKKHYRTKRKIQLTQSPSADLFPVVHPDGNTIAYITQIDDTLRLAMMDINGTHKRVLPLSGANVIDPAWSPDGSELLLTLIRDHHTDLVLYNPDTGVLTDVDVRPTYAMKGVWSPKGNRIAYLSNQSGMFQLMMYDLRNKTIEQITDDPHPKKDIAWAPNGREMVYVADVSNDNMEIFYLDLKNGYTERLTFNPVN